MTSSGSESWFDGLCASLRESQEDDASGGATCDDARLGQLAVAGGLITQEQLQAALLESADDPSRLQHVLVGRGWINTSQLSALLQQLAEQAQVDDRYEIIEELGRGGMAVVYRARDRKLGREVALKILRRELLHSPVAVSRMVREARVIATLNHPGIVKLYDVGDRSTPPYLVMELLRGAHLGEVLRTRSWPMRDRVQIMEQVSRAVAVAHQHGIVHCDLKPGNVLLEDDRRPVVTDFGLAHLASSDSLLTRTAAVLGTPMYMAPEQARGRRDAIDARADVYALGVMLYEAIAGKPPFRGNVAETLRAVVAGEFVAPRRVNPSVPADLQTITLRAMATEPRRRYPDAGTLADDLDRFLRGEAILARPPSIADKGWRALRRRGKALALAAAASLLTALVVAALTRSAPLRPQTDSPSLASDFCRRALLRKGQGDFPGALDDCASALRLRPDFGLAYLNRAIIHQAMRNDKAMIEDLDHAIQIMEAGPDRDRSYLDACVMRGKLYLESGDAQLAATYFTRALDWKPDEFDALIYRGLCHAQLESYRECVRDLARAVHQRPDAPAWVHEQLAKAKDLQRVEANYVLDYRSGIPSSNVEFEEIGITRYPETRHPETRHPEKCKEAVAFDKAGTSTLVVRFQAPTARINAVLELRHLSAFEPRYPHEGASRISVVINGETVCGEWTVCNHDFKVDALHVTTFLREGANTVELRFLGGTTPYWLSRLEIRCHYPPGTKIVQHGEK